MFDELRSHINRENMDLLRRQNHPPSEHSVHSSEEDSDLNERLATFSELMHSLPPVPRPRLQTERRQRNQVELLQEAMKLKEQQHQREVEYLKDSHEAEIKALRLQVQRLEQERKRVVRDEGLRAQWMKDSQRLAELQAQYERDTEQLHSDKMTMKKEILSLKVMLKQKEEQHFQVYQEVQKESGTQKGLKEQLSSLKEELLTQQARRQQLEKALQMRKKQCQEVTRQLQQNRVAHDISLNEQASRHKSEISRIEEENKELKKRNQNLESMFMEHLSQTSLSIQQGLRGGHEKSIRNTTLPLPDSPIRPRSKPKEELSPDLPDPQKETDNKCKQEVRRLQGKLQLANRKLVQLLSQKCRTYAWSHVI